MRNFIAAYGGKILTWVTTVLALLAVPATAASLHFNETDITLITLASAALNSAHAIFFSSAQQAAAKVALKGPWSPPPKQP